MINTTQALTPWTISAGTLQISMDANLGNPAGAVTINGGTLETTASFPTNRAIAMTGNNGTIETDAGTTFTVNGVIADAVAGVPGGLTKAGAGNRSSSARRRRGRGRPRSDRGHPDAFRRRRRRHCFRLHRCGYDPEATVALA